MSYVRACADANFDAATQTCETEEWVQQPAGWIPLPELTVQEGADLGFAILGVWFVVWVWKQIGKTLDESSKPSNDD